MVEILQMIVSFATHMESCRWRSLYVQSQEREREERFVNPANHNASVLGPMLNIAVVLQGRAHVPSQKTPTHDPKKCEEAVDSNVEIRSKADAAVHDYRYSQRGYRKQRRRHEL